MRSELSFFFFALLKTKGESGRKFGYPNSTTFPTAASCRSDLIFLNPVHSFFVCVNQNAKVFKGLETREKTGHASCPFPFHVVEKTRNLLYSHFKNLS